MTTPGNIKVVDSMGTEIPVVDYLQMEYTNCRLISCIKTINNEYLISVENPKSTGRAAIAQMRLTEESLYGLLNTIMLFFSKNNVDVSKIMLEQYPHDQIRYMCPELEGTNEEANIEAFDKQLSDKMEELKEQKEQ